jgi:hypothetical protein
MTLSLILSESASLSRGRTMQEVERGKRGDVLAASALNDEDVLVADGILCKRLEMLETVGAVGVRTDLNAGLAIAEFSKLHLARTLAEAIANSIHQGRMRRAREDQSTSHDGSQSRVGCNG